MNTTFALSWTPRRPPGRTESKNAPLAVVNPRRPFGKEPGVDYAEDSGEEWEDEARTERILSAREE